MLLCKVVDQMNLKTKHTLSRFIVSLKFGQWTMNTTSRISHGVIIVTTPALLYTGTFVAKNLCKACEMIHLSEEENKEHEILPLKLKGTTPKNKTHSSLFCTRYGRQCCSTIC